MWLSRFEHSISELTAECQGPQSCFPVNKGMSLVAGKGIFKMFQEEELFCERVERGVERR
jgi:hypothetical protein